MMAGPGRSRRRRGRRGQRPRQEEQQQKPQDSRQDAQPDAAPDEKPASGEGSRRRRDGGQRDQGDHPKASSGRKRSRSKRRSTRRPSIGPMPTEVLREEVRDVPTTGEVMLRELDDFTTPDGMTFGCPMLTRTSLGMPFAEGRAVPRCSMGWALHSEDEASLCMRTPDLLDCWKEHPENEAALRASSDEENAAD